MENKIKKKSSKKKQKKAKKMQQAENQEQKNVATLPAQPRERHELIMPSTEEVGELQNMETGTSLIAKYRTQEEWHELKDEPVRCFFMGMKQIPNDEGELINCGVFAEKGGVFLSAQMVLVDAVTALPSGTPIAITYRGKKKNKMSDGSTNMFDVQTLK